MIPHRERIERKRKEAQLRSGFQYFHLRDMERDKGKSNKKKAKIEKEEMKVTGFCYDSDYGKGGTRDGSCNRHALPDRVLDKRSSSRERYQQPHKRSERSQYSRHDDSWKMHDSPDRVPHIRSSSQHPHKRSECSRYSGHDGCQRSMSPRGCSRGLVTPTCTVVMNGLPRETSEEDIHQILEEWGPLRDVRVMKRKNSTACRGIAFIDFPSVAAARKMMDQIGDHGLDANGRKLCFAYRPREISELATEDSNSRVVESEPVTEEEYREENDDGDDNEKHEDEYNYVDEVVRSRLPDPRAPEELRTPKVGDESYSAVNNSVLSSLVRSTKALEDAFNSLEGVTCEKADEGLYLFPRIQFPQKAIKAADAAKTAPDAFYAKRLLEATGIVVLPGSDFGQVPSVWFVGLPILLQEEKIQREDITVIITRLTDFHEAFMTEFHD